MSIDTAADTNHYKNILLTCGTVTQWRLAPQVDGTVGE